ncbi:glycosyltransferase family 2 protein [Methanobacterium sp.]|uniref:glycosyltransferase family 2 protein n=1 Tax=Methanobacterium sp. TaxID=2164 RepID=UPI003D661A91
MPTFNRANYLIKAVESALAQDYINLEVIVSDNDSKDETSEIMKNFVADERFKYFKNEKNMGMVANWRKAVYEHAEGDFFLILSDDDYFMDNKYISKAVELIEIDNNVVIVYANGYLLYENLNKYMKLELPFSGIEDGKTIFLSRQKVNPQDFTLCNILFDRKLAMELNAFSNNYNISCDSEIFLKMCLYGKIGVINDFVSVYLIHSSNLIDKQKTDFNMLINNLDYIFEPYKLAQSLNVISKNDLKKWEDEVIVPIITIKLVEILIFHKEKYEDALEILDKKNHDALLKSQKTLKLRMYTILSKINMARFIYNLITLLTNQKS